MNKTLFFIALLSVSFIFLPKHEKGSITPYYPKDWPDPIYSFEAENYSKDGFELGRLLFYDPILSRDSIISCASCHLSYTGFTHVDHALSHGINDRIGNRNAPALINLAWQSHFHWDGGVKHLEAQALNPITHPKEMDQSLAQLLNKLNESSFYQAQFEKVFKEKGITTKKLLQSISYFTSSLISFNSTYDKVMRKEIKFSPQEQSGYRLFMKNCANCHQPPLFTKPNFFASNGLEMDTSLKDLGRYSITLNPKDSMLFKVPTLRNIVYTFPYMHDGRFKKLKEVIQYYSDSLKTSRKLSHPLKKAFHFNEKEQKDLLAFLYTLSDTQFLFDKNLSFPEILRKKTN